MRSRQRCTRAARTVIQAVGAMVWLAAHPALAAPKDVPLAMRCTELAGAVLQLLNLGEKDIGHFPWLEPPREAAASQALTLLRTHRFDLMLTDVVMPGRLNGKGLADEVERSWPGTRVVFMSGYSENVLLNDGRLDRGVMLLAKPHQRSDLARIIRSALSGGGRPGLGDTALQG